jgi:hypothetical protein
LEFKPVTSENPKDSIGPHQPAPHASTETNNHKDEPDAPSAAAVVLPNSPPPPQKHCEITVNTKRDRIDWWTVRLEGFGLFVLCVYTVATIAIWCANKNAADAAKTAADTARDALVIGNRPWIKVDLSQTAPLEFLPDGSAKIGIQERIENIGSSVALRVESWFNVFPLGSTSNTFLDAKVKQKEGCDAIRFPKTTILEGEEMFPHDPMLYFYAETISKDQIVPIKDDAPGMGGQVGQVGFILAGCVTYRSSFEDPKVPSHETLFEYWIAKPVKRGGVIPFLDPVGTHPDYSIFRLQNGLSAN